MKKIIAKKLVLIIGTVMIGILLLNMLIQRENATAQLKDSSKLVIKQIVAISDRNEQNIYNNEDVNNLISKIPVSEGTSYYVVDKKSMVIIGNIGKQQIGTPVK